MWHAASLDVTCVCVQCEGVGKDSIPGAIDFDVVDDMMQVTDKQSFTVSYITIILGQHLALCTSDMSAEQ